VIKYSFTLYFNFKENSIYLILFYEDSIEVVLINQEDIGAHMKPIVIRIDIDFKYIRNRQTICYKIKISFHTKELITFISVH